jgi:hypothetical protein
MRIALEMSAGIAAGDALWFAPLDDAIAMPVALAPVSSTTTEPTTYRLPSMVKLPSTTD